LKHKTILSINCTTKTPRRVELICKSISSVVDVHWFNWNRNEIRPDNATQSNHTTITTLSLISFLRHLWRHLRSCEHNAILFDDFRLLPILFLHKLSGAKVAVIYNRQEIPTITAAVRIRDKTGIPYKVAFCSTNFVEYLLTRTINAVITIPLNQQEKRRIASWSKPFIELANYPSLSDIVNNTMSAPESKERQFIYSGAISDDTGLEKYLQLFKNINFECTNLKPTKLLLIGHLGSITKDVLMERIEQYKLSDFVTYKERVPYDELVSYFETSIAALAFADPDNIEFAAMGTGASRKLYSYMAAGLPIIAAGAFSDSIVDKQTGIITNYHDTEAHTEAALRLLRKSDWAKSLGDHGKQIVISEYNWESYKASLTQFIRTHIRPEKASAS